MKQKKDLKKGCGPRSGYNKTQVAKMKAAEEAMQQAFRDAYEEDNDDNQDVYKNTDKPLSLFAMIKERTNKPSQRETQ